jgi:hypothetical protein
MSAGLDLLHDMFSAPHQHAGTAHVSPYVIPPTIPAGMTIAEYRRGRPARPSMRRRLAAWVASDAGGAACTPAR